MHVLVKALAVAGDVKEVSRISPRVNKNQFQCNSSPKSKCQGPPIGIR